jgi:hypothetical protein
LGSGVGSVYSKKDEFTGMERLPIESYSASQLQQLRHIFEIVDLDRNGTIGNFYSFI